MCLLSCLCKFPPLGDCNPLILPQYCVFSGGVFLARMLPLISLSPMIVCSVSSTERLAWRVVSRKERMQSLRKGTALLIVGGAVVADVDTISDARCAPRAL